MENQQGDLNEDERKLDKKTIPWIVLGLIVIGISVLNLWSVFNDKQEATENNDPINVPDFALTNQKEQTVELPDLKGKIWIADFIFTHCPTICPIMTEEMAKLQSEFSADPVYFVSFTVDPERDTPDVLMRYAVQYGADQERWYFLTGDKEQIYKLANKGFKLAAADHGGGFPHSSRFALVTSDGYIHDYYDSRSKPMMNNLRKDVKALLKK